MTRKQYIALGIAVAVLGAGSYYSELRFLSGSHSAPVASLTASASSAEETASTASISVEKRSYAIAVSRNETVIDAMRALESAGTLTFTGKNYPGMGFFVESINGKRNFADMYWMLYVNGNSADTGASQTAIHSGDIIEWRYESS